MLEDIFIGKSHNTKCRLILTKLPEEIKEIRKVKREKEADFNWN